MNPLDLLFAVIIFGIAYLTGYAIKTLVNPTLPAGRYQSIDGIRGILSLSVFISHTAVWYQYFHTNKLAAPASNLFNHFGQTSVSLFFMITSFLFITKLLNDKERGIDWAKLYFSRFFRIVPMYIVSVAIMLLTILFATGWKLNVSFITFITSLLDLLFFSIRKSPVINNYAYTQIANAGVYWSLLYEWLFYFSLPIIALFILKKKPTLLWILVSFIFICIYQNFNEIVFYHLFAFAGGAAAALLHKYFQKLRSPNEYISTVVIIICLALIGQYHTANTIPCVILNSVIFILIALGASLFGLLRLPVLRFLGEICYSIYLLHGCILFILFYFVIGFENAKDLTPLQYFLLIFGVTPFVVIFSYLGFIYVEKPFMQYAKKVKNKKQKMAIAG